MTDTDDQIKSKLQGVEKSTGPVEGSLEGAQTAISLDELVKDTAGSIELAQANERRSHAQNTGKDPDINTDEVRVVAGAPVPGGLPGAGTSNQLSEVRLNPSNVIEQVDRVLTIEDPEFLAGLEELKSIDGENSGEAMAITEADELIVEDHAPEHSWAAVMEARKNGVKPFCLEFLAWGKYWAKSALRSIALSVKSVLGSFMSLQTLSKIMVFGVFALSLALTVIVKTGLLSNSRKTIGLPLIEASFLGEFTTTADHVYEYEDEAQMVNFLDPMLHPENVVLVDHIVVNLKNSSAHENPMALIDFYIEVGSREAAIEVKSRDVEVRDSMSRVIEQISYEDITTDAGKYKLKVILRKSINDFLTSGRVRRIYFKTFVLKP